MYLAVLIAWGIVTYVIGYYRGGRAGLRVLLTLYEKGLVTVTQAGLDAVDRINWKHRHLG